MGRRRSVSLLPDVAVPTPGGAPVGLSEKVFLAQVVQLAKLCGWRTYHPWISVASASGWPDLALCRPPRFVLAELKAERGRVTAAQAAWLSDLQACALETYLWRPSQWEEIAMVLR